MKLLILILVFLFSSHLMADCTLRLYVDPIFSRSVTKEVESIVTAKKYKILAEGNDHWEKFRLKLSSPKHFREGKGREVISLSLQKFKTPEFDSVFHLSSPLGANNREEEVKKLLRDLPSCTQALYAELFETLN